MIAPVVDNRYRDRRGRWVRRRLRKEGKEVEYKGRRLDQYLLSNNE